MHTHTPIQSQLLCFLSCLQIVGPHVERGERLQLFVPGGVWKKSRLIPADTDSASASLPLSPPLSVCICS